MNTKIIHLGIDWEDFALVFFDRGKIKDYRIFSNDFYKENEYLLSYLNKESIKATFFCNARTAEIYPDLLKKIVKNGHQIASHGYTHKPRNLFKSHQSFFKDSLKAKKILEKITNQEITGYRSPYLSFNKFNYLSSLDILASSGYKFDSSITFSNYNKIKKSNPLWLKDIEKKIEIKQLFSLSFLNINLNLAGGSIWRLLPSKFIDICLMYFYKKRNLSLYFHPYEFGEFIKPERALDINPSNYKKLLCWIRWNLGRKKIENLISIFNRNEKVKYDIY